MRIIIAALLTCALAGCGGGGGAPGPGTGGGGGNGGGGPPLVDIESTKAPVKTPYQGFMADVWGKRLLDADVQTSYKAAVALGQIGRESAYYMLMGMDSDIGHVQSNSVLEFPFDRCQDVKPVLVAQLKKVLKSKHPAARADAGAKAAEWKMAELLPDVNAAFLAEKNKDAQDRLSNSVEILKSLK